MASALAHELNQPPSAIANYIKGSQRLSPLAALVLVPIITAVLLGTTPAAIGEMALDGIKTLAPTGVMFDSPDQIVLLAPRIKDRAVVTKTMPFINKTGMGDDERELEIELTW